MGDIQIVIVIGGSDFPVFFELLSLFEGGKGFGVFSFSELLLFLQQ